MSEWGLGAGLAAVAFWMFIAAAVVAGIWNEIRKRETQHETLRRVVESGQALDEALIGKLLQITERGESRPDRDFRVTAMWILPVSAGLVLLALVLGLAVPQAKLPLLGAAAFLACLGLGFLLASRIAGRWYRSEPD